MPNLVGARSDEKWQFRDVQTYTVWKLLDTRNSKIWQFCDVKN